MKKTILLILTFMIPLVLSAGHWVLRDDLTIVGLPKHIRFINDEVGYFTAYNSVHKTIDGGDSWNIIFTVSSVIYAFDILEVGTFWVGTDYGKIIFVTNDGANSEMIYNGYSRIYDIRFLDENIGVAVGRYGLGIKTTDGGNSWQTILNNGSCLNRQIRIIHGQVLLVAGDETLISTDFGNTWQNLYLYDTDGIYAYRENYIWIGGVYNIYHYDGYNFNSFYFGQYINPPISTRAIEIDFVNIMEGWFCTENYLQPVGTGFIFHTIDGGETWQLDETDNTYNKRITGLCMINENKGFAGAYDFGTTIPYAGCLYEYKPDVEIQNDSFGLDWNLEQNYPNPFNPDKIGTTKIQYSLPHKSNVSLKIYNIKGELVKTLVDEKKRAGYHSIIWNGRDEYGNDVASGIYFYKAQTIKFSGIKSMLLLRYSFVR